MRPLHNPCLSVLELLAILWPQLPSVLGPHVCTSTACCPFSRSGDQTQVSECYVSTLLLGHTPAWRLSSETPLCCPRTSPRQLTAHRLRQRFPPLLPLSHYFENVDDHFSETLRDKQRQEYLRNSCSINNSGDQGHSQL